MSVREYINKQSRLIVPATICVVVVVVFVTTRAQRSSVPSGRITKAFYSIDDGKTWFADSLENSWPFEHDGKLAYRAYVYQCRSGSPFVGYLGRRANSRLEPIDPTSATTSSKELRAGAGSESAMEVKEPGQTKWVPLYSPEGSEIANRKCPDGAIPDAVLPAD